MAEQNRKQARRKQPISRHPLFPATVALWFGAFFGLGSLAIRPNLLEALALATQIDLLIPALAPPLGQTSRILLALAMAGAGGLAGGLIARHIGRPKQEVRQRKRGAGPVVEERKPSRYAVASQAGAEARDPAPASRRRSLAMEEENLRPDFQEHAPLPGGAPQILNLSDYDFDGPEAPAPERAADELDLGRYTSEEQQMDATSPSSHFDFRRSPAKADDRFRQDASVYRDVPETAPPPRRFDAPAPAPLSSLPSVEVPPTSDERPFAPSTPIGPAQPFAAPAPASDPLARLGKAEPANQAERQFQVRMDAAPPLFTEPTEPAPAHVPAETAPAQPMSASSAADPANQPSEPAVSEPRPATAQEEGAPASPDRLSNGELLERLAQSLQRRRAARQLPSAVAMEAARCEPASAPGAAFAAPLPYQAAPPMPPAFEAPAPAATTPSVGAPVVLPEVPKPFDAQPVLVPPSPAPTYAASAPAADAIDPVPPSVPAALRPVGLYDDDDSDLLPSFVPPRHFAMPIEPTASPASAPSRPEPFDTVPAPTGAIGQAEMGDETDDESAALEDGYSSLLDLTLPASARSPYVRIEEPEPDAGAVEPVVVFPGHAPAQGELARGPVQAVSDPARPFDAPGRQTASPRAAPAAGQDPAETERALRAALATLQRMSGAA